MVSKRYLNRLDLTEYQMVRKSNLFANAAGEFRSKEVGEDTDIASSAQEGLGSVQKNKEDSGG